VTIQTKHFIDLSDIISLRFECKDCGTTLTVSIKDKLPGRMGKCPSCNQPWAVLNGASYELLFETFREAVNHLSRAIDGPPAAPIGFSFSLEIKADSLPVKN
jgi:hypothetical protein